VFTGKKRMGAERAEEKGDIYLFIVYLFDSRSFSQFFFFKAPNHVLARTLSERVV